MFSENVAGRIPILAINTNIVVIDSTAFANGRIAIGRESPYYDGSEDGPYLQKQTTLFALGFERSMYHTDTFTLNFDRMLFS